MASGLDGEICHGRHEMAVRVYYEDTDFSGVIYYRACHSRSWTMVNGGVVASGPRTYVVRLGGWQACVSNDRKMESGQHATHVGGAS